MKLKFRKFSLSIQKADTSTDNVRNHVFSQKKKKEKKKEQVE